MSRLVLALFSLILLIFVYSAEADSGKQCGNNARWANCALAGNNCHVTCANHRNPPTSCTRRCLPGCDCKDGYVFKNGSTGDCVRTSDCRN